MEKEAREQKLAELEKEIKDKRKKSVKKVTKEKEVDTGTTKKKNTKDIKS